MKHINKLFRAVLLSALAVTLSGCGEGEPLTESSEPQLRRLTEQQYRNTIRDVFGGNIVVAGRFDPLERIDGLLALGASSATITPAALERYEGLARTIALQVVDEENRKVLMPCAPASATARDNACAETFVSSVGRFLFRRPLTDAEQTLYTSLSGSGAESLGDFYQGLAYGLTGMMVSPKFLYINETVEADPEHDDLYRLDAYSKATRLSFLLWNTTPNAVLLDAAAAGDLDNEDGLEQQFERMIASPRVENGLTAFFEDMLEFERFDILEKDPIIYPAFILAVTEDAKEQTLRTLTHLLLDEKADYRDIFTTRKTFISGALGPVYRVPVENPEGWAPYEFPDNSPWAGIHTHLSFQALFSHPGKSSPTLRGQAVREHLLCQKIPEPPGDVDFSDFNDDTNPINLTARQRLTAHNEEASCAGCHKLMDPIGLAMETFDGAGQLRTTENGAVIDTSGELDGIAYTDAVGLGQALRQNPSAPACVTHRLYAYGTGHSPVPAERQWMAHLEEKFAETGYKVTELLKEIVLSDAFYRVAPPSLDTTTADAGILSTEETSL
ncbi:MAG: DUF1592 domain-containing protein [Rhodospirillaceae bacterium]|jgi:hypothetical protein|nr:DUF1592 domain-containing protein [Rhodospirillaceae bacterium]MBT5240303.1 DUF1592 domain-containing protein [Rhodospirillaceae bacterium]MBT5566061.1 DUF1592 domain-containing protein [Rhodospirillaceae bacterium]MBT6090025.1 DUF1592 domain-containing protein [Rhodospirillaceae bacterium]